MTGVRVPGLAFPARALAVPRRRFRPLLAVLRKATSLGGLPRRTARGRGHGLARRGQRRQCLAPLVPPRAPGLPPVVPRPRRRLRRPRRLRPCHRLRPPRRLQPSRQRPRRLPLVPGRPPARRSQARPRPAARVVRVAQPPGPRGRRPRVLVACGPAVVKARARVARAPAAPVAQVPHVRARPVQAARRAAHRGPALVLDRGLATTHSAQTRPAWARPRAATAQSVRTGRRAATASSVVTAAASAAASVVTASQGTAVTAVTAARVRVSPARPVPVPVAPAAVALVAPARLVAPAG